MSQFIKLSDEFLPVGDTSLPALVLLDHIIRLFQDTVDCPILVHFVQKFSHRLGNGLVTDPPKFTGLELFFVPFQTVIDTYQFQEHFFR